ncbi:hypothetical protein B6U99_05035, partial [Candidatus Geothermarchaeota archaeon ex4572_27]
LLGFKIYDAWYDIFIDLRTGKRTLASLMYRGLQRLGRGGALKAVKAAAIAPIMLFWLINWAMMPLAWPIWLVGASSTLAAALTPLRLDFEGPRIGIVVAGAGFIAVLAMLLAA